MFLHVMVASSGPRDTGQLENYIVSSQKKTKQFMRSKTLLLQN